MSSLKILLPKFTFLWSFIEKHDGNLYLIACFRHIYQMTSIQLSRCRTRGESEDHTVKKARQKGSTLALKSTADVNSPKQGYQWPLGKDVCPPKYKTKNKKNPILLMLLLLFLLLLLSFVVDFHV